jgi:hypothetical protein
MKGTGGDLSRFLHVLDGYGCDVHDGFEPAPAGDATVPAQRAGMVVPERESDALGDSFDDMWLRT